MDKHIDLELLNQDYCDARRQKAIIYKSKKIIFATRLRSTRGMMLFVIMEPDDYYPIPNTWRLSAIEEAES